VQCQHDIGGAGIDDHADRRAVDGDLGVDMTVAPGAQGQRVGVGGVDRLNRGRRGFRRRPRRVKLRQHHPAIGDQEIDREADDQPQYQLTGGPDDHAGVFLFLEKLVAAHARSLRIGD
jgi:hypothetical protein